MQLTVLGSSAAYPGPGSACSGCLVEEGETKLLVDCGTGVLSNLQRVVELRDVNFIVISHLHADHCVDLIPYRHALTRPQHKDLHPYLYLPPGGGEMLLKLVSAFHALSTFLSDFFLVKEYDPNATLRLGDLRIEFALAKHYIEDYAMAISGSKRIVYSADSGLCDELEALARDADLFLCEATKCEHRDADWGHLSADEVGMLSKKARVKRLMLTHFWPDCDYSPNIRQAEAAFGRVVEVAKELCTYAL